MKTDKEAEKEIIRFEKKLLENVIKIIKLNQEEVRKLKPQEDFHRGSIAFGDVLIHILKELKKGEKLK